MIPHKTLGSGISGTVRYVMGEGKRDPVTGKVPELILGEKSRVVWYGGTGFGFPIDSEKRIDIARRVMEWAAENQTSKTKRCREDCLHLVLSWDPAENPTRVEMETAAHSALEHLGMGQARALFAAHNDTAHKHLHLVISRINPETGKAFPDRFDTLALSTWALQWERDHGGVRCEARLDRERQQAEPDPENALAAFVARRETFTAFDLNRILTKAIPARETRRAFIGAALTRPEFVRLADPANGQVMRYTTRQTLAAEHLASGLAERLADSVAHGVAEGTLRGIAERLLASGKGLRDDQMQALRHATRDAGLAVIAGKAGTGKSFAMSAIAAAYEADGYTVQALAPTNKVASALKRDGLEAATLHSMLGRLDRGQAVWNRRSLVMLDEAGMISTRLMARLLSHAEHAGAKVILVGDDKQLASMERGGMFGYLATEYGVGALDEITRQRGAEQRELARRASQYDFQAALTALEGQGGIFTCATPDERIARTAALWQTRSTAAPDSSLFVITVSNADAQDVNRAIREIRRQHGDLGPDCLLPTSDGPRAFAEGDRILFSGSAGTRDGRAAGLVNGNAGLIKAIDGDRVTVALDGAKFGETVSFTVGPDRAAGAFDAIRLGYAGTIYKAQGATYDHTIVVDNPMMRASSAYVALTRHRDTVSVVRETAIDPDQASWVAGEGGLGALTAAQRSSAEKSYKAWCDSKPGAGQRHDLANYVAYVQGREAERRQLNQERGEPIADMAKRWGRIEDRRAASRFEALDYQAPAQRKFTPAAVRAAVGVERFEQDQGQVMSSIQPLPSPSSAVPAGALPPQMPAADPPAPVVPDPPASTAVPGVEAIAPAQAPLTDDTLRLQVERQTQRLRHLGQLEERARALREAEHLQGVEARAEAYRRAREVEAEEARQKKAELEAAETKRAREGDISSASARYAIALGENYAVFDPYASLARAAMAEYAMMMRAQERMRQELAGEEDPARRRVIELRMQIESCDYMALTSDRLAGISLAITGQSETEQAVADRARAQGYSDQAATSRSERSQLTGAIQDRVQVSTGEATRSIPSEPATPEPAPETISTVIAEPETTSTTSPFSRAPVEENPSVAANPPVVHPTPEAAKTVAVSSEAVPVDDAGAVTTAPQAQDSAEALAASAPASAPTSKLVSDVRQTAPPAAAQDFRRRDTIEPPAPPPYVTMRHDQEVSPPASKDAPWLDVLRRRFEHEPDAAANREMSDNAVARLAKRLEQGKSQDRGDKERDGPGPDVEPDV